MFVYHVCDVIKTNLVLVTFRAVALGTHSINKVLEVSSHSQVRAFYCGPLCLACTYCCANCALLATLAGEASGARIAVVSILAGQVGELAELFQQQS